MSLGSIIVIVLAALFFGGIIYLARFGGKETQTLSGSASSPEPGGDEAKAQEGTEETGEAAHLSVHRKHRRAKKGHRQHA